MLKKRELRGHPRGHHLLQTTPRLPMGPPRHSQQDTSYTRPRDANVWPGRSTVLTPQEGLGGAHSRVQARGKLKQQGTSPPTSPHHFSKEKGLGVHLHPDPGCDPPKSAELGLGGRMAGACHSLGEEGPTTADESPHLLVQGAAAMAVV